MFIQDLIENPKTEVQVSCTIREGQEEMNVYDDGNFSAKFLKVTNCLAKMVS